jgi:nucleoside-diphosphate-sugar epimerase
VTLKPMRSARLAFFAADLERDEGWAEAVAGCDYVIHVASPIPPAAPKSEDELIVPARDGVLRVLKAARDAKVKRVVLTSSLGAVYYGHPPQMEPFDERSWTNLGGEMSAYVRSKAIAERAAWDFMAADGGALELSVINPAGIFGPVLGPDFSSSIDLVARLMNGMLGCPRLYFGVVDVRDVADLHLRAMTHSAAKGERFIAVSGAVMSMLDIATVLKARLGGAAKKVPTGNCRTGSSVSSHCSIRRCGRCYRCSTTSATRRARRPSTCLDGSRDREKTRSPPPPRVSSSSESWAGSRAAHSPPSHAGGRRFESGSAYP